MNHSVQNRFSQAMTETKRSEAANSPDRLCFHIMPPVGWLNDPNGLCEKDGINHIYYQFAPESAAGNTAKGWGHCTTKDWIHYTEQPVPLFPDSLLDEGGAYSGSALVCDDGKIRCFYTGNRKLPGEHDYIYEGRQHWTCMTESTDGTLLENKQVLLKNEDYPKNMSCHVRDPKVWKDQDGYRMILGARTRQDQGMALLYTSKDLKNWTLSGTIEGKEDYGYMWECPDFLELDKAALLLTCLQGAPQKGYEYENLYPSGYFQLEKNPDKKGSWIAGEFRTLDHGFDFYAPQTFVDENGRRILIGWMGIPDVEYTNREAKSNWQHALTLPRELTWKDGQIYQYPIEEMFQLAQNESSRSLELEPGKAARLDDRVCLIELENDQKDWSISLRHDLTLSGHNGVVRLELHQSGLGRTTRHAYCPDVRQITIFSDTSSVEIFINHGQVAFTTRLYDAPEDRSLKADVRMKAIITPLASFEIARA